MSPLLHDDAEFWAAAAATGGLTETEFKAWSNHIGVCPACKKLNDEEFAMGDLMRKTFELESPDPGFEQRMILRLSRTRVGKGNRWYESILFHPAYSAAAACLLAVVIGGALLIRGGETASVTPATLPAPGKPSATVKAVEARPADEIVSNAQSNAEDGRVPPIPGAKEREVGEPHFTAAESGSPVKIDASPAAPPKARLNAPDKVADHGQRKKRGEKSRRRSGEPGGGHRVPSGSSARFLTQ